MKGDVESIYDERMGMLQYYAEEDGWWECRLV